MGVSVPTGSISSYQLAITEANFELTANLDTPGTDPCIASTFPDRPIENSEVPVYNAKIPGSCIITAFLDHVKITCTYGSCLENESIDQA